MKRISAIACGALSLFFIVFISATLAYAELVSSKKLIEQSEDYNGKTVIFKGEALSAIIVVKGGYGWINVRDGYNAVGIYCPQHMLKAIKYLGDYNHTGDTLEVEGVFNRSCQQHGGELDIHANKVTVIKKGTAIERPLSRKRFVFSLVLFAVTILVITTLKIKK